MNLLDTYYKALLEYKRTVSSSDQCKVGLYEMENTPYDVQKISAVQNICKIDEDWIKAIEEGLIHIEKAIKEERQFIHSNGEVLPIELVKSVSRESVEHLSKHSNLISRESEEIVPEKLYTVERLNDYLVYENRFLYMLLCRLKDFVSVRYNKLTELIGKYSGTLIVEKKLETSKDKLSFSVHLDEEHFDDEYLKEHSSSSALLDRIDIILKTIMSLLSTPLMEYASKAPLITPPITKTNILKMDNNFKGAVDLYDFIISYDKDGYSYESIVTEKKRFNAEVSKNISQTILLLSFLTYQHSLSLEKKLKTNYETEESLKKIKELEKKSAQLDLLKKKLENNALTPEEYVIELEDHSKKLRNELSNYQSLILELEQTKTNEIKLNNIISEQSRKIEDHLDEIYIIQSKHESEIEKNERDYKAKSRELQNTYEDQIEEIKNTNKIKAEEIKKHYNELIAQENDKLSRSTSEYEAAQERIAELIESQEKIKDENNFLAARVKALCEMTGHSDEPGDYTSKEDFYKLENEFKAFKRFYNRQWKKVKKKIRKESFTWNNIKKQDNND